MQSTVLRALAATTLALVMLGTAATVTSASTQVRLRIEGDDHTIFEGDVSTGEHRINGHKCDGTNGGASSHPGPTATSTLDDAADNYSWSGKWFDSFEDFLIERIGNDEASTSKNKFWEFRVNYHEPGKGGCQTKVESGDNILWAYDGFGKTPLKLSAPGNVAVGDTFTVHVEDGEDGHGVSGVNVGNEQTNGNGDANLRYESNGRAHLKASKSGTIRSNEQVVCVGDCTLDTPPTPAAPLTQPAAPGALPGRITAPLGGHHYSLLAAPRVLRGSLTTGGNAVHSLRMRLRRNDRGHCSHYSLVQRRFHPSRCVLSYFFYAIRPAAQWSYTLPVRLLPGTYTLDIDAVDALGRRARPRLVFYVTRPPLGR